MSNLINSLLAHRLTRALVVFILTVLGLYFVGMFIYVLLQFFQWVLEIGINPLTGYLSVLGLLFFVVIFSWIYEELT